MEDERKARIEAVKEAVRNLYYQTKRRPRAMEHKELYKEGKELFGSWTETLKAAGIAEIIQKETLQELKVFMAENDRTPSKSGTREEKRLYEKIISSFSSLKNALLIIQGGSEDGYIERPSCALPPSLNCTARPKLVSGHSLCCEVCKRADCSDRCINSSDRCNAYHVIIIK